MKKEVKEENLNDVVGGHTDLEKYLKRIKTDEKPLVDEGTGVQLTLDSTIQSDDGKLIIIKREKKPEE